MFSCIHISISDISNQGWLDDVLWDERDVLRHRRRLKSNHRSNVNHQRAIHSPASVASVASTTHFSGASSCIPSAAGSSAYRGTKHSAMAPPLHLDPNDTGLCFLSLQAPLPSNASAGSTTAAGTATATATTATTAVGAPAEEEEAEEEAAKKAAATRRALQLAIVDDPLRPMVPRALLPVGLDVK